MSITNLLIFGAIYPSSYWSYEALQQSHDWTTVLLLTIFYFMPILLGALALRDYSGNRYEKLVWILALGIFPMFHLITGNPQSYGKHMIYGLAYASPIIAIFLENRVRKKLVILFTLASFACIQFYIHENNNIDTTKSIKHLESRVNPTSTIVSNFGTYSFISEMIDNLNDAQNQIFRWETGYDSDQLLLDSDFILWADFPNERFVKAHEKLKITHEEELRYSCNFVTEYINQGLPFGFHTIDVIVYKKKEHTQDMNY